MTSEADVDGTTPHLPEPLERLRSRRTGDHFGKDFTSLIYVVCAGNPIWRDRSSADDQGEKGHEMGP